MLCVEAVFKSCIWHPGARGGRDQFNWENVKSDKDREFYLGHSVKASTGRWQKGKPPSRSTPVSLRPNCGRKRVESLVTVLNIGLFFPSDKDPSISSIHFLRSGVVSAETMYMARIPCFSWSVR